MPEEPNKKMDELLRAYAEERRKAPELYLHPATRKMLQGEVSRVHGRTSAAWPWLDRLRSFWPQIAFGASLCVILGIAVLSLRQPARELETRESQDSVGQPESLGREVQAPSEGDAVDLSSAGTAEVLRRVEGIEPLPQKGRAEQVIAPSPAPRIRFDTEAEILSLDDVVRAQRKPEVVIEPESRANTASESAGAQFARPQAATRPPESRGGAEEEAQLKQIKPDTSSAATRYFRQAEAPPAEQGAPRLQTAGVDERLTEQSPAAAVDAAKSGEGRQRVLPSIATTTAGRAREMTNLGAARRMQFVQMPEGGSAGAPVALFSSFQVEQLGTEFRVLDQDGSIYQGVVEPETNAAAAKRTLATVARRAASEPVSAPANSAAYNFTVRGTNITLGLDVVLKGQYFERTNVRSSLDTFGINKKAPETRGRADARYMIIGDALVGDADSVPVRAVARDP